MKSIFLYLFLILWITQSILGSLAAQPKPNIILILVDDMGFSDLSCFGSEIKTPNIDFLAENGQSFTKFYNAGRCCPSRASLLTGLYPHQAGMGHQNKDLGHPAYRGKITKDAATIAEVLKQNGYYTYQVGKWHVGSQRAYWPDQKGFDQYFTLIEGAMNYFNQSPWVKNQDSLQLTYNGQAYRTPENFYATTTFTDTAVSFIQNHPPEKPFFMYLAYNAPHWPLHAPQQTIDLYKEKYMIGWDSLRTLRFQSQKEKGVIPKNTQISERFPTIPSWRTLSPGEKSDWAIKMALYAAVMHHLDLGIGKMIQTLEAKGQLENTLILFLSDNGACHENPIPEGAKWAIHPTDGKPGSSSSFPSYDKHWANVSNTPFRLFKSYLHEGGIITPLIVCYPGVVPSGKVNTHTLGHIKDLMPTLLDFADAPFPEMMDGRKTIPLSGVSLYKAFVGKKSRGNQKIFWEHQYNRALRDGDWKLVSAYKVLDKKEIQNSWELYNLKKDPTEQRNLASKYPKKVKSYAQLYETWANSLSVLNPTEIKKLKKK